MPMPPFAYAFIEIDGTLLRGDSSYAVLNAPRIPQWKVWRLKAWNLPRQALHQAYLLGQARYRAGWIRGLAGLTQGWSRMEVDALYRWVARHELSGAYRPDLIQIIRAHQAQGTSVILISSHLNKAVKQVALQLHADGWIGTRLQFENSIATGRIKGYVNVSQRKLPFIRRYLEKKGYTGDFSDCIAYVHNYVDSPLLAAMGKGVAVYPETLLRAAAVEQGWYIHDQAHSLPPFLQD